MTPRKLAALPTGVRRRHARSCAGDTACTCSPTYQARVYSQRDARELMKAFPTLAAAKSWRSDTASAVQRGTLRAPVATTVRQAAASLHAGMRDGSIRNRSGDSYKPSVIRSYDAVLARHVLPAIGSRKLSDVTRRDVQDLADHIARTTNSKTKPGEPATPLDASTVRNALMPLRVIYRRAVSRGDVAVNPTTAIELRAVRGRRDRIASPTEAAALLAALPLEVRALYATACYAGLRRGELRALRWEHVDFTAGELVVEASMDDSGELVAVKSKAGVRRVPMIGALRSILLEHRLATGAQGYVVSGRTADRPFSPGAPAHRAATAWTKAKLDPIGLHEMRHTYASILIAAGVNAKAISTAMGHSSISITFDRYGHLMPGSAGEVTMRVDAYLAAVEDAG